MARKPRSLTARRNQIANEQLLKDYQRAIDVDDAMDALYSTKENGTEKRNK